MKNTVTSTNIWIWGTNTRCSTTTDESENFTHLLLIDQNNACSVTQGLNFQVELMIILVLKYFTLELIHKEALTHYKDFHNNFCQKIIVKLLPYIKLFKISLHLWKQVVVCMEENCIFRVPCVVWEGFNIKTIQFRSCQH